MDALSPSDHVKLEVARSIREDFLHQNAFHKVDTYTSLNKQYFMMKTILMFHEVTQEALKRGATAKDILNMKVRERIGRFKYVNEESVDSEYKAISDMIADEINLAVQRGDE